MAPLATFEAAFLPGWKWEVETVEERDAEVVVDVDEDGEPVTRTTDLYFGRVTSPHTHPGADVGAFSAWELRQAGAFRTDKDTGEWP